jgi:hypothetical protein
MTDIDKKLLFQQNSALCSGVEGQFHCMPAKRNDCGHKFYYSSSEFPVTMPEINEFFCRNSRNSKVMIKRNKGSVLLITIFLVAFLAAIVMGMLQVNTQELRFMMDHIQSLQAVATAEAGLNDALYQIRQDKDWNTGFNNKGFSRIYRILASPYLLHIGPTVVSSLHFSHETSFC